MLGPGKHRRGCSQSAIGWNAGPPNGGARESTQGAKGICNPIGGVSICMFVNAYLFAGMELFTSCVFLGVVILFELEFSCSIFYRFEFVDRYYLNLDLS